MTQKEREGMFRICVDQGSSGRVYSCRIMEPFAFADLGDLLLKLERILEAQDYPQAAQIIRTFQEGEKRPEYPGLPASGMSWERVQEAQGVRMTFDLLILSRFSATWQGYVQWSDGSRTDFKNDLSFLSAVAEKLGL